MGFSQVEYETGPCTRGQGETKKEEGHSRLVGDNFIKQGNFVIKLILGVWKTDRSLHLPANILKVYVEALTSHIYSPGGLNNKLFS